MSSLLPESSLHDLLLSSWRRDHDHPRNSHPLSTPSHPPKVICYSDALAATALQDNQSKLGRQFIEHCEQYVLNYLPSHLLRISDKSLVTRAEFWEAERPRIVSDLDAHLEMLTRLKQDKGTRDRSRHKRPRIQDDDSVGADRDAYVRGLFRFAMFSHRWGDNEPLFDDVLNKRQTPILATGFEKLFRLCEKASADYDCHYIWSDTCCINKESSVELDESIRSMYRWYSIATVCIVHLAESLTIADFESEPWFRRGWTLQELLAPKVIKFYGKNWKPICREKNEKGDKAVKAIWTAIETVTRISPGDLWHFYPSCDRVAEKMKWASQRRTTKIEDAAYALLGIFNVTLPIAYGEADRAWYRLMTAIANECTDASFFAWAGPPSTYSRALPSSPASYLRLDPHTPVSLFNRRHPTYKVSKLGVSIKLLVVPTRCNILEDDDGREVGFTVNAYNLEHFLVSADVPPWRVEEYKLGVVNFDHGSVGDTTVNVGYECHCLILAKERSGDPGWFMVNTECVVVVRCSEEICAPPENVLLYHGALPRQAHRYHPAMDMTGVDQ